VVLCRRRHVDSLRRHACPGSAKVVAKGGRFYAISSTGVWRSANGLNWTALTTSPGLGFVNDVTVENGVMIAVGTDDGFDEAMIWTSADGVTWTSIGAPEGTSELTHVAARGGDMVVIGDGLGGHGRKLFFQAAHTNRWQEIDPFGEDQDGRLVDLASNGRGFVAVGYWDDWDSGRRWGVAVSSIDGSNWTRSIVGDRDGLVFDQVTVLPGGRYLAIASVRGYAVAECRPSACIFLHEEAFSYLSSDGTSWAEGPQIYVRDEDSPEEIGDMVEHPRAIAAGSRGVVILDDWADGDHVFWAPPETF